MELYLIPERRYTLRLGTFLIFLFGKRGRVGGPGTVFGLAFVGGVRNIKNVTQTYLPAQSLRN